MNQSLISRLLYKNTSVARIVGFILSNFLGLAIVLGGLQFYLDAKSIWEDDDSFIHSDYLVINKRVTSQNTFNGRTSTFSSEETEELSAQPWVKRYAPFSTANYKVYASIEQGGTGLSTNMFFESIPDSFVDAASSQWGWREGSDEIPVIISKDYLSLYNFGFATSAGLPQMSEGFMSGIPLKLSLRSNDGTRALQFNGRIAGYSNRLNTILVPQEFMDWSNKELGSVGSQEPSRLIVEVSSPGDVAIKKFLDSKDWEIAGDKSGASASFLLKVVIGIILAIGIVITALSLFILLLSISLLMEKNREKLHRLLMLGYPLSSAARPYRTIAIGSSLLALILAVAASFVLRGFYIESLTGLGATPGNIWLTICAGALLTLMIILFNLLSIRRKIRRAWRL